MEASLEFRASWEQNIGWSHSDDVRSRDCEGGSHSTWLVAGSLGYPCSDSLRLARKVDGLAL